MDQRYEIAIGSPAALTDKISYYEAELAHVAVTEFLQFPAFIEEARTEARTDLLARATCLLARAELIQGRHESGKQAADRSIELYERLGEDTRLALAGPFSEALRTAGNARIKIGALIEALPLLDRAVRVAEQAMGLPEHYRHGIPVARAVLRNLTTLGFALIGIREFDGAIEILERAGATVDSHFPTLASERPDEVLMIFGNLSEALRERARSRWTAGQDDAAERDFERSQALLEQRARPIVELAHAPGAAPTKLTPYGEQEYWQRLGQNLLLKERTDEALAMFRRQFALGEIEHNVSITAFASAGIAECLLALGRPAEAIEHALVALAGYDENDEAVERAPVFLTLSRAHQALGSDGAALAALEEYYRLRTRIDAVAAHQYATHMTARVELERARIEADAQRRIASELKKLNTQLFDQARALEAQAVELLDARSAAETANRAKSAFLANMSHELRTPLNAILGFSEMMRDGLVGPPGANWTEYAGHIHDAGAHLLVVINDVLDLSKIEAGRMELDEERIDVSALLQACRKLVGERARQSGLRLSMQKDAMTRYVLGDLTRLKQILLNLLTNAIKFTPRGGTVALTVKRLANGETLFVVKDTGIGMAPDEIWRALEVFGQADTGLSRKHEGTGLGLPLAVRLAQLHGGSLTIDSQKNVGTTVRVRLPPSRTLTDDEASV